MWAIQCGLWKKRSRGCVAASNCNGCANRDVYLSVFPLVNGRVVGLRAQGWRKGGERRDVLRVRVVNANGAV